MLTVPVDYPTIQEAINHSSSGGTVFVKSGVYTENLVVNTDGLRIVGENRDTTVIDGGNAGTVVYLVADNAEFSNFTVQNSGSGLTDSGIYLNSSSNSYVSENSVSGNNLGIYLFSSSNSVLRNNNLTGNEYNFGVSGSSLQDYIHDIDLSNLVDGKPVVYWVNEANKQPPDGAGYVAVVNSTNVTVDGLTLTKNWQAILFAYSTDSTIKNVAVTSNMDALWLIECSNCSVCGSTVKENNWGGIAIVNSINCSFQCNNITSNKGYGIFLSDSSGNLFYHNSLSNTNQVWFFGFSNNSWDAGTLIGGNYWSNYNGTDTDEDGIGDTPYVIDSNNTDSYPLMQPWVISSSEEPLRDIALYVITVIAVVAAICVIVAFVLKHNKGKGQ